VEGLERSGGGGDFREGDQDGKVVGSEGGEGGPGEVHCKVGGAKGQVRGCGLSIGREAGGGVFVEEAQPAPIESFC